LNATRALWGECLLTIIYVINRAPPFVFRSKTPYEDLFKAKSSYNLARFLGCLCYVASTSKAKDKFRLRNRKCTFAGDPFGKKDGNYLIWKVKKYLFVGI